MKEVLLIRTTVGNHLTQINHVTNLGANDTTKVRPTKMKDGHLRLRVFLSDERQMLPVWRDIISFAYIRFAQLGVGCYFSKYLLSNTLVLFSSTSRCALLTIAFKSNTYFEKVCYLTVTTCHLVINFMLHCFPRDANAGSLNQEAPKLLLNWKFVIYLRKTLLLDIVLNHTYILYPARTLFLYDRC